MQEATRSLEPTAAAESATAVPSDHRAVTHQRTQAFAVLLLLVIGWTCIAWIRDASKPIEQSEHLPSDFVIDLNIATLEELNLLPGVGPKLAQDILEYRNEHHRFRSVDELSNIRGIKGARLTAMRKHLHVAGE